ncbi:pyridoxal-phosphate-dependent aminotransferase family protein [Aciduricibacillus chroicocephali]
MLDKQILRIPGPTPIPPRVEHALGQPMIGHRNPQMGELHARLKPKLAKIFGTKKDVMILSSSGTGAMETAAVNLCKSGDEVIVVVTGAFGERFADICDAHGLTTYRLEMNWGTACTPEKLKAFLREHPSVKAVFMTYCETSTSVLNPIKELTDTVRSESDALVAVDGVSCIAGVEANMDDWGVDIYVTGSQKAFMLPPGLAFVAASERAREAFKKNDHSRFYFDLNKYAEKIENNSTPFTPPVSLLFGLDEALNMMMEEGLENVFKRHRLMSNMTRSAIEALGIPLLTENKYASPTVTAVKPEQVDAEKVRKILIQDFKIYVAGGPKHLKGKIFRIGHMGYCSPADVFEYIAALEVAFKKAGANIELGAGTKAAQEIFLNA